MRFWDSSALVPLLVKQEDSVSLRSLYADELGVVVWWSTSVECASAVSRLEREGKLSPQATIDALGRLDFIARSWSRVEPEQAVLETARRFLRAHPLRAADSLQLAAAFLASEEKPSTLELVCLDDRLAAAARREGFVVRDCMRI